MYAPRKRARIDASIRRRDGAIPYYLNFQRLSWLSRPAFTSPISVGIPRSCSAEDARSRRKKKGITVIPDCGLAPGMVNILAEHGSVSSTLSRASESSSAACLSVLSRAQLSDRVFTRGSARLLHDAVVVLRGGKRTQVTALSKSRRFVRRLGRRARGLSHRRRPVDDGVPLRGEDSHHGNKTLRYPGHAKIMEAIRELGCWSSSPSM